MSADQLLLLATLLGFGIGWTANLGFSTRPGFWAALVVIGGAWTWVWVNVPLSLGHLLYPASLTVAADAPYSAALYASIAELGLLYWQGQTQPGDDAWTRRFRSLWSALFALPLILSIWLPWMWLIVLGLLVWLHRQKISLR
jgi:hypothetical protein